MTRLRLTLVMIGCLLVGTLGLSATPDSGEIDRLIKQLGDEKFARREAACKALEQIGPAALDPLRRACGNEDPEVQRRAKELVRAIERRMEREEILRPTLVRLDIQDAPIPDAVAELAKLSGYSLLLGGDAAAYRDKKVTLRTEEVSFWQALDLLCLKAGLTHAVNPQIGLGTQNPGNASAGNLRVPGRVPATGGKAIVLVPGDPPRYPTYYAGALRLRLLPPGAVQLPGGPEDSSKETVMTLEVCLEPKLLGHEVLDVSVIKALDDRNQPLAQVLPQPKRSAQAPEERQIIIQNGQQVIVRQVIVGGHAARADIVATENSPRLIPLRFKLPDQPGHVLSDLEAILAAQVRTPIMPLVTVDDVTAAVGKEIVGRDGLSLTVVSCIQGRSGEVILSLRVVPGALMAQAFNPNIPIQVLPNNQQVPLNVIRAGLDMAGASQFTLTDGEGHAYQLVGSQVNQTIGPNGVNLEYRLTYRPQKAQAQPRRLTLSGSRLTAIELPFAMHNIPLVESH